MIKLLRDFKKKLKTRRTKNKTKKNRNKKILSSQDSQKTYPMLMSDINAMVIVISKDVQ